MIRKNWHNSIFFLIIFLFSFTLLRAQNVMWEKVNVAGRDLFFGPGGKEMLPDLSEISFIKEEKAGHTKKYRIKDGKGQIWIAKLGREARPETVAVRLLYGLGYKTDINYLVPKLTIPNIGTFENVRLETRSKNVRSLGNWKWLDNPFRGTNELQGLKIMMVFMTNWDVLDIQNDILEATTADGKENQYIVSDLGATFGRLGNNNFPLFFRFGRTTGKPFDFAKTKLIRKVKNGKIELSYKGKNRDIFKNITIENAKWLYALLSKLSDKQIADAFRAANYSPSETEIYTKAVKNKIAELAVIAEDKGTAN